MTTDARKEPSVAAKRGGVGAVTAVLMAVLLLSSGYSVFFKPPGPTSYPFHVGTLVLSALYLVGALVIAARSRVAAPPRAVPVEAVHGAGLAATLVFFACLGLYQTNFDVIKQRGDLVAPYTAWLLVRTGGFTIEDLPGDLARATSGGLRRRPDGALIGSEPPGAALSALPLMGSLALFRERAMRPSTIRRLGHFLAALYTTMAVILFYLACRRLTPKVALAAALLLGLGTGIWPMASQGLLGHAPALLWLSLTLFLLLRSPMPGGGLLACLVGLAVGLAVLTRPMTIVFAIAAVAAQAMMRGWRAALWTAGGAMVPAGALLWYNAHHFGRWMGAADAAGEGGPVSSCWLTLAGLTVAPSGGLLVYSPALVLAIVAVPLLWRARTGQASPGRVVAATWGIAAALLLTVAAARRLWPTGDAFGPRALIEAMPAFALLAALGLERLHAIGVRPVGTALIALSILVQTIGVFGHHRDWNRRHPRVNGPASLFSLRDTQIEAHSRHLLTQLGALKLRHRERRAQGL